MGEESEEALPTFQYQIKKYGGKQRIRREERGDMEKGPETLSNDLCS